MRTRHLQAIKPKQNISLENLASKQRIFQIVKEQHGFMLTVRSKDCSNEPRGSWKSNLNIAPVRFPERFWPGSMLVEPAGIEPATSCLQSRRSPS
jgi:hypothetical protein